MTPASTRLEVGGGPVLMFDGESVASTVSVPSLEA